MSALARKINGKKMIVQRKNVFKFILLMALLSIFISCSDKNPTSPSKEDVQDKEVFEVYNITFSVIVHDPIPTAFLNSFAKLLDSTKNGLAEVTIKNENNFTVLLKCSFRINNYTDESFQTQMISAKDSTTMYFTPIISYENLKYLNENTTVNCSVKTIIINDDSEKEIFNQAYTRQMLANDTMIWGVFDSSGNYFDLSPFIVLWVTPHATEVEELISKAVEYHHSKSLKGYQGSESEDGYKRGQKLLINNTDKVSWGKEESVWDIYIDTDFMKNCVILGNFYAEGGTGNDIKVRIESGYGDILYDSGQIHQGTFTEKIIESGYHYLIFDNSFSLFSSKTVSYNLTLSYDEDLIIPQVKAIYEALQNDYGINYVSSTISFPDEGTQRIRFPEDALTYGTANCIDGTVLFASALENIGIEPLVVLIPGHAFVGYRRWYGANVCGFLETTMISNSSFEEAYNEGKKIFEENYKESTTKIIDVKEWRDKSLTPLMKHLVI